MRQGKTVALTYTDQKIREAIEAMGSAPFCPYNIIQKTGCKDISVRVAVYSHAKRGYLEKIGHGWYRKTNKALPKAKLQKSFVAQNIWEVLMNQPKHLSLPQIVTMIVNKNQVERLHLGTPVANVLNFWCRSGFLERLGTRGRYSYKLKPNITERPVVSFRAFILPA